MFCSHCVHISGVILEDEDAAIEYWEKHCINDQKLGCDQKFMQGYHAAQQIKESMNDVLFNRGYQYYTQSLQS